MTVSWDATTVGDVMTLQRGFDVTKSEQRPGDVPVVSSGGIASYNDTAMSPGPGVIIGRKGTLGKVFYIPGPYWPHDTTLWVKDFKGNDPRFTYYFLKQLDVTAFDVGSANPTLNRNHVHPLQIRWPRDVGVQRAIAQVLGALDDKIAANVRIKSLADELLSAQLSRALADEGATTVALGDIASVNSAVVRPNDGQLRYIDIAAVGVGSFEYPELSDWSQAPSRARRRVSAGDTLWSSVRPNRRSHALNLSDDPTLIASTGLAVLSPTEVGFAYLYEVTNRPEFSTYLERVAEGSAYPAVRADRFESAPVRLLSKNNRDHFESVAAPLRRHAHALAMEDRSLAELRDTLLPHLMSGKVRVRDAEKQVEEVV